MTIAAKRKIFCLTACIGVLECRLKWVQSLNFRFDIQNMNFRLAIQVLNFLGWLLKINYVQLQPIKNGTYFVIILLKTIIDRGEIWCDLKKLSAPY